MNTPFVANPAPGRQKDMTKGQGQPFRQTAAGHRRTGRCFDRELPDPSIPEGWLPRQSQECGDETVDDSGTSARNLYMNLADGAVTVRSHVLEKQLS